MNRKVPEGVVSVEFPVTISRVRDSLPCSEDVGVSFFDPDSTRVAVEVIRSWRDKGG